MEKSNGHQKHANLVRPNFGQFGRQEWAILGTPCGTIQALSAKLVARLSRHCKVAYVDADHQSADQSSVPAGMLANGATFEYTDKIHFHRFDSNAQLDAYQFRSLFNEQDVVLVNGNHFKAKQQIVVIDPKKRASLHRKLDRLSNVAMILTTEGEQEIYPFLKDHLGVSLHSIPVFQIDDVKAISDRLLHDYRGSILPLKGLVLAGGRSQRMGEDKGAIAYHGKPQRVYAADLLQQFCADVYISCRPDQVGTMQSDYPLLPDKLIGLGPFGAIATAFQAFPNHAWLVVACDLPLLNKQTLNQLVGARNTSAIATAFQSPSNEFPEPLITIWEPKSYSVLLQFLAMGYSCPRKVLINSEIELIQASDPAALTNVNVPTEKAAILQQITTGKK